MMKIGKGNLAHNSITLGSIHVYITTVIKVPLAHLFLLNRVLQPGYWRSLYLSDEIEPLLYTWRDRYIT